MCDFDQESENISARPAASSTSTHWKVVFVWTQEISTAPTALNRLRQRRQMLIGWKKPLVTKQNSRTSMMSELVWRGCLDFALWVMGGLLSLWDIVG